MLSYRHAFHAGNHADVLKHLTLIECMRLLSRKEKGFLVVDTHAGAGAYTLEEGYAAQNKEWADGIQRFRSIGTGEAPPAAESYVRLAAEYADRSAGRYPGSPALIARLLRDQDRAVFCELHPTDHQALEELVRSNKRARVRRTDGFAELKALLPPPTRRGLVFIDPSYELASDYDRLIEALRDSLRRFAEGVYMIWYPLLEEAKELPVRLTDLTEKRAWLNATLRIRKTAPEARGMTGSGLFILNPPWTLAETLADTLPYLVRALGCGEDAGWTIDADG
jgi:23S rRNA (adenine2030-N6)-methyltransferase